MPTAGRPHCGTKYMDSAGYWDKVRHLAYEVVRPDGGSEDDALSLFGNLNLDTDRSGDAREVNVSLDLARWVLETISDRLRPRILVLLGLRGKLKDPDLGRLFNLTFDGFELTRPHWEVRFHKYREKRLKFREWAVRGRMGNEILFVMWPQHPSRPPFARNLDLWKASCQEFKERRGYLVD